MGGKDLHQQNPPIWVKICTIDIFIIGRCTGVDNATEGCVLCRSLHRWFNNTGRAGDTRMQSQPADNAWHMWRHWYTHTDGEIWGTMHKANLPRYRNWPSCHGNEASRHKVGVVEGMSSHVVEKKGIIGSLSHACKVVKHGCSFLRRLMDLAKLIKKPNHYVLLNREARSQMDWDLHDVSGRQRQLLSSFSVRCLRKLWCILCWSVVPAPVARVYPRLSDHSQVAHTNCPSMVTLFPVFFLSSVTFTWEQKSDEKWGRFGDAKIIVIVYCRYMLNSLPWLAKMPFKR